MSIPESDSGMKASTGADGRPRFLCVGVHGCILGDTEIILTFI